MSESASRSVARERAILFLRRILTPLETAGRAKPVSADGNAVPFGDVSLKSADVKTAARYLYELGYSGEATRLVRECDEFVSETIGETLALMEPNLSREEAARYRKLFGNFPSYPVGDEEAEQIRVDRHEMLATCARQVAELVQDLLTSLEREAPPEPPISPVTWSTPTTKAELERKLRIGRKALNARLIPQEAAQPGSIRFQAPSDNARLIQVALEDLPDEIRKHFRGNR